MTFSPVLVLPDRYVSGWGGDLPTFEENRLELHDVTDLKKALLTHYTTDAHATMYASPGALKMPRLKKSSISFFEVEAPEDLPTLNVVFIDVDFPDHGKSGHGWDTVASWPPSYKNWQKAVDAATKRTPELKTAGAYQTRGGLRLVLPIHPDKRPTIDRATSFLTQFLDYLIEQGLPCDRLVDWTRLMRLPFVRRDGQDQRLGYNFDQMDYLDWTPPLPLESQGPAAIGKALRTDFPDITTVKKPAAATWKDLQSKPYFYALNTGTPFAESGSRKIEMRRIAASIVAVKNTNDPMIPFSYMLRSVQKQAELGSKHGPGELWRVCVWVCEIHDGTKQIEREQKKALVQTAAEHLGCDPRQVRQRLILATATSANYYILNEKTFDYEMPTSNQSHIPMMLAAYCPELSGVTPHEKTEPVSDLLKKYATSAATIVVKYDLDRTYYDEEKGVLYEAACRKDRALQPRYTKEIDQWLRLLGGDQPEKFLDWLASFLIFDKPTCALYIKGPPSIGKGMLADGIARIWNTAPVPYATLLTDFQGELTTCPFIVADEKVPEDAFKNNDSSVFRQFVGNGVFKVNQKYKPMVTILGNPRILITANNADALRIREALEQEDIEAIQKRIGYIQATNAPREYLEKIAVELKYDSARSMTEEWVSGGKIAQHILWLAANREIVPGDRFLVEGWPSELTSDMAIKYGGAPVVGKFIVTAILDKLNIRGVKYGNGEILVNLNFVMDSWQDVMGKNSKPPSERAFMAALKILSNGERRRIRDRAGENARYFWQIDPARVARIAEEYYISDAATVMQGISGTMNLECEEDEVPF